MSGEAADDDTAEREEVRADSDEAGVDPDEDPASALADVGGRPVLLFDGVCTLCNGAVQWIIRRDPDAVLAFAPLQSPVGTALQERYGLDPGALDSVVLVDGRGLYTKSTAAIRVAELLGWPYTLARAGRLIPRPIRDRVYDFVADNRYDWVGRREQCMVPDEDVSDRFLG